MHPVNKKNILGQLQNQRSFTDNDMESIDNARCVVFCKTSIEAGIQQERIEINHYLDLLFNYKDVEFKQKPKK